jgi:hypothetical protein
VSVSGNTITLRALEAAKADGAWTKDALWGLKWEGGYAQVGKIERTDGREVTRSLTLMNGDLKPGQQVVLESFAFAGDPMTALGIPFDEVTVKSPLGNFPAWHIPGAKTTWAIFVHGKGSDRREALRLLPTFKDLGYASLVITYRNDVDLPLSNDGYYDFGETEWEDLAAAVGHATAHGAKDVVLIGYSMGGALVTNFQYKSPLGSKVRAVVLDAPVLDFGAVIDLGGQQRSLPRWLTWIGKSIAGVRFGFDWRDRDYLKQAEHLNAPILLFHGEDDTMVPITSSDRLAQLRPDLVTYVRTKATHVRSWNLDPEAYTGHVKAFLTAHAP